MSKLRFLYDPGRSSFTHDHITYLDEEGFRTTKRDLDIIRGILVL